MQKAFIKSVGIILALTGMAKLYTGFSGPPIIYLHDPILGLQFRYEFPIVGTLELIVALLCLFTNIGALQLGVICWLSTCFSIYRIGLWSVGINACPCLGDFAAAIHLSKTAANLVTIAILVYFLTGSYLGLLKKWNRESQ